MFVYLKRKRKIGKHIYQEYTEVKNKYQECNNKEYEKFVKVKESL